MNKLILVGAAMIALPVATPAFAQSVEGTVTVNGNVAPKCLFTLNSGVITIPELAGADGKLDPATVNGQSKTLTGWCNGTAATMQVLASPLDNAGSGGASFDTRIHYTASALANAVTATDTTTTDGVPGDEETVGLFSGDIVVTLSAAASAGGKLLLAGAYTGNVVVTLTPTATLPEEQ